MIVGEGRQSVLDNLWFIRYSGYKGFQPETKEVSTNNCCKFIAIFIVFPGFCLKQLQQLFSDNS